MPATPNGRSTFIKPTPSSTKVPVVTKKAISNDYSHHVEDLIRSPLKKRTPVKMVPALTYMTYMSMTFKNFISTLIFDWSMAFTHPLHFLALITLVPLLSFALLMIGITFHIGFALGMGSIIEAVGRKWGANLTMINWWDPSIFTLDVTGIVKDGISALGRPPQEPADGSDNVVFNIDIAELLLFMSSIIYERDEKIVRETYEMIDDMVADDTNAEVLESAMNQLKNSVSRIHDQANLWGLEFVSLSELNSLGGPFSGIFYSKEHNFIVVVFKGTTPIDFKDFVIDLMLQRIDASNFVFGEIHCGMYTSLFSQTQSRSAKMDRTSPYITIVEAIRSKAVEIVNSNAKNTPVNVWVTGHSLGAALASIFFSRCLKSPEDLGPNCILRDGYLYGCPAVGNSSFASLFSSYSNQPFDRSSTLWRVVNDTDIVAHLSGFEDITMSQVLANHSILDYTHVGEEIRFFRSGARPRCTKDVLPPINEHVLVKNNEFGFFKFGKAVVENLFYGNPLKKLGELFYSEPFTQPSKYVTSLWQGASHNPLKYVEMMLPIFYRNHIPAEYFRAMQNARRYFVENSEDGSIS
ncbi:6728_t:CDS:2 [Acaulospora morrowiae]|uniref:6728_t:CDS:1 n=1 Tax=Acaulospora morrowiae TaxID=94023 RepID=A0A9N9ANM8_9GLOM|nr:6728_t:CDS:2 [Acaulospora morrowiae]